MPEDAALAQVVRQALFAVAGTTGLSWKVKGRVLRQLERNIRTCAYASAEAEDFAEWCRLELADLLADEEIRPLCRLSLAAWFAQEVLNHLTGSFDGDEAA